MGARFGDRGAVLAIAALAMVGLVAMVALVVDIGFAKHERRRAQNAVDAAALAGSLQIDILNDVADAGGTSGAAADLCLTAPLAVDATSCVSAGGDPRAAAARYAAANGFGAAVTAVSWPPIRGDHAGDLDCIEVTVDSSVDTFFGRVVGQDTVNVDARAVACGGSGTVDSGSAPAILALGTCGLETLDMSGANNSVIGGVEVNDGAKVSGSGNVFYDNTVAASARGGRDDPDNRVRSTDWTGADVPGVVEFNTSSNSYPTGYPARLTAPLTDPLVDVFRMADFLPGSGSWAGDPNFYNLDTLVPSGSSVSAGDLKDIGLYNDSTKRLRAGIYYTTRRLDFNAQLDGVSAGSPRGGVAAPVGVTVIHHDLPGDTDADGLFFSGSNGTSGTVTVASYVPDLFAFTDEDLDPASACEAIGSTVMTVSGQSHRFTGVLYAPKGRVELSGSNTRIEPGAIVATVVKINGSNLRVSSLDLFGGGLPGDDTSRLVN